MPTPQRIQPVEPPYANEVATDFEKLMPPGMEPLLLFRTVANNPRVLRRLRRGGLLDPGSITPREREIVILRTTALCDSEYEWGVHVSGFAESAGLSAEHVRATVLGDPTDPVWSARESALIRACDELHHTATLGDDTWSKLSSHFGDDQLIELIVLAGFYHAISFVTNAVRIPLEELGARFPRTTSQKGRGASTRT